ncbi:carbonic anhydrase [Catenuloplanes nepalensis]|uniref:Carbonic anhydrase n=1 Tax=Catenuloplanes nepalensis TaxID=587533 RepID=A0ABT9MTS3_9ACTN|nr:carbonic anhydrase [Catenuloplanes nepalensis]MDP9794421.1 carbonic anhydrase [Catenuloplanes nepalensis]
MSDVTAPETTRTPAQALDDLIAGNERFVAGVSVHPNQDAARRATLVDAQAPKAVLFGCSDSRLAAEIIFDQGLGDLFVVRTAGHVVGREVLGSIEYAVSVLRTPLIIVLGHNSCGAVQAAREADATGTYPTGHLRAVVDALVPSVELSAARGVTDVDGIVDVHIQSTVDQLRANSATLAAAVYAGTCAIVGMSYQLDAGRARMVTPDPR